MATEDIQAPEDTAGTPVTEDAKLGQITITYNGPDDATIDPPVGMLNRDVQTMNWHLVDRSGLNAKFAVPGGIVFPFPVPNPPPAYSKWTGTVPVGDANHYSANAEDRIPHGNPPKLYSYDIVLERDAPGHGDSAGGRTTETMHARDLIARFKKRLQQDQGVGVPEIIDPPVENQPQP
jgi:hypothetical protein